MGLSSPLTGIKPPDIVNMSKAQPSDDLTLDKLLKQKGLKNYQFCELIGLSGSSVRGWKRGESSPSVDSLIVSTEVLGVGAKEFLRSLGFDVEKVPDDHTNLIAASESSDPVRRSLAAAALSAIEALNMYEAS